MLLTRRNFTLTGLIALAPFNSVKGSNEIEEARKTHLRVRKAMVSVAERLRLEDRLKQKVISTIEIYTDFEEATKFGKFEAYKGLNSKYADLSMMRGGMSGLVEELIECDEFAHWGVIEISTLHSFLQGAMEGAIQVIEDERDSK